MFRTTLRTASIVSRSIITAPKSASLIRSTPFVFRSYSASALAPEDIKSRILEVLKSFEKVDPAKVSSFPFVPWHSER